MQELDDLQALSSREQLRTNRTAAAARGMRYPVRLSGYAFQLLTTFLQAHRLALPLALLNEHVALQARLGLPPCASPFRHPVPCGSTPCILDSHRFLVVVCRAHACWQGESGAVMPSQGCCLDLLYMLTVQH